VGSKKATSGAVKGVAGSKDAQTAPSVSRLAPAKINLYLHVAGRRSDGFHCLDSLFVFADFGDGIKVTSGGGELNLTIDGPFAKALPTSGDNLVMKAADAFRTFAEARVGAKQHLGADIRLTKSLPVAAGIGGGSADAAATLHALNRFWNVGATLEELTGLAAMLGADVPACLHADPVQAAGIGEILIPSVPLPGCAILLVNPGAPLLTVDVFKAFAAAKPVYSPAAPLMTAPGSLAELIEMLEQRRNDLQPIAERLAPAISAVIKRLCKASGSRFARLSGSGPTCFGLFADLDTAAAAGSAIAAEYPLWWVQSGTLLSGAAARQADVPTVGPC